MGTRPEGKLILTPSLPTHFDLMTSGQFNQTARTGRCKAPQLNLY